MQTKDILLGYAIAELEQLWNLAACAEKQSGMVVASKMLKNNLKLYALVWKAKSVGKSYGQLCVSLSEKETAQIYLEYEQLLERKNRKKQIGRNRHKETSLELHKKE